MLGISLASVDADVRKVAPRKTRYSDARFDAEAVAYATASRLIDQNALVTPAPLQPGRRIFDKVAIGFHFQEDEGMPVEGEDPSEQKLAAESTFSQGLIIDPDSAAWP